MGIVDVEGGESSAAAAVVVAAAACTSHALAGQAAGIPAAAAWAPSEGGWFAQLVGVGGGNHFEGRAGQAFQPFHGHHHSV